ncbi:Type VII secretion system Rv3446c [Mycobacteriaceae bacterium]
MTSRNDRTDAAAGDPACGFPACPGFGEPYFEAVVTTIGVPRSTAVTVVEVGPAGVQVLSGRSAARPDEAMVSAVLDGIDDDVALFDERPVAVAALMRAMMSSILGDSRDPVVIVHPSWWSRARIDLVVRSSGTTRKVVAVSRSEVARAAGLVGPVIEIAEEFVAVAGPGLRVFGRGNIESVAAVAAVAAESDQCGDVLLDAPAGIAGSAQTAERLRVALAARGRSARDVDVAAIAGAVPARRRIRGLVAAFLVASGVLVALVLSEGRELVGAAVATLRPDGGAPAPAAVNLVEGRIVVEVPSHWNIERVRSGSGSRRVQVDSPTDADVALHITAAYAPGSTLAQAAEVLGDAVAAATPGVFVGFRPAVEVAGRPAVTYREVRAGRVVDWSVVLSGSTRIGIGCQSAPGEEDVVRGPCEQAVRSARELGTPGGP